MCDTACELGPSGKTDCNKPKTQETDPPPLMRYTIEPLKPPNAAVSASTPRPFVAERPGIVFTERQFTVFLVIIAIIVLLGVLVYWIQAP